MPMEKYRPEQIATLLRQVEIEIANRKTTPQACKEAAITDPLLNVTKLTSYPTGLINTVTDAQQNVTAYVYDTHDNRTSVNTVERQVLRQEDRLDESIALNWDR